MVARRNEDAAQAARPVCGWRRVEDRRYAFDAYERSAAKAEDNAVDGLVGITVARPLSALDRPARRQGEGQ
jgi:hypothetical protein